MSLTKWCPSCGSEYTASATQCSECRVALVDGPPPADGVADAPTASDLVEMGEWPRSSALLLRRRLESAGVPVMIEFRSVAPDAIGTLVVPEEHADFAWSVIQEVSPDEEMPDRSPSAYLGAIEERLAGASALLDELRTAIEQAPGEDPVSGPDG